MDNYVAWRLANGSLCNICPLNGQRKVGCDGPDTAPHIALAEAPGKTEEQRGVGLGEEHGTPLVGKSGKLFRDSQIAKAGLAPEDVFIANVIMCRPPGNKINSKEGKQAVACCANSARRLVAKLLRENPERTLDPMGATALALLIGRSGLLPAKKVKKGQVPIEPFRGRFMAPAGLNYEDSSPGLEALHRWLEPEPEEAIYKRVLRGRKPKEEWWPTQEKILKSILSTQVRGLRAAAKKPPMEYVPALNIVKALIEKQKKVWRARNE